MQADGRAIPDGDGPGRTAPRLTERRLETYGRLANHADYSAPRFTHDHGVMELVSFESGHELVTGALWWAGEIVATLSVPKRGVGSTTSTRADLRRGVEADSGFYVRWSRWLSDYPDSAAAVSRPRGSWAVSRPVRLVKSQSATRRRRLRQDGMWLR